MDRPLHWSSSLAAVMLGSAVVCASGPVAAQGLRADLGRHSAWSFGVDGFAQDSGLAWRWVGATLDVHLPRPGLGEAAAGSEGDLRFGMAPVPRALALDRLGTAATYSARGVSGTARYAVPLAGIQLFGGGGAGLYQFRAGLDDRYDSLTGSLGVHAVAGLSLPVADDTEVGISLRRVWFRSEAPGAVGAIREEGGRFIFLGLRLTR